MKVLALQASPRPGGNSEVLLNAVLSGLAGGDIDLVNLTALNIGPCINCGGCEKDGICVFDDDMEPLYDMILAADRVIFASPIYFYNITAKGKLFIDRTQALWNRQRLPEAKGAVWHNRERRGYLVSVAATRGRRVFEGAVLTMKYAFDAMGLSYGGELLVRGIDRRGEMAEAAGELEKARAFGRECLR